MMRAVKGGNGIKIWQTRYIYRMSKYLGWVE